MSQNRVFDTMRSLIPPFILLWADGLSGDFNDHPKAKSSAWPALIVGVIAIFFSIVAAGFGYPLYDELVNLISLLPSLSSYVFVGLIAAGIYTLSQKYALFQAETKRYGISRISGYEARMTLYFLLFLGLVDAGMNLGGQAINASIQRQSDTEQVYSGAFQFSQQGQLDKLNAEIEQLEHPVGCSGHTACKSSCPYDGKGASHVPGGQLTKFGREALRERRTQAKFFGTLRETELNNYNKVQAAQGGTATIKDTGRSTVSYIWVVLLYVLMYGASRLNANYTLNFEEACNALPNYELLVLEREDTERRLNARKEKLKAQKQRIREHRDQIARQEAERNRKLRRSRRMQSSSQQRQEQSEWRGSHRAKRNRRPSPTPRKGSRIPYDDEQFYEDQRYYEEGGEYGYEVESVHKEAEQPEPVLQEVERSTIGYPKMTEQERYIAELERKLEQAQSVQSERSTQPSGTVLNKKRSAPKRKLNKGLKAAQAERSAQAKQNAKRAVHLRNTTDWSMQQIADELGVSKSAVHRYLNPKK